jgi:hypothetical protein
LFLRIRRTRCIFVSVSETISQSEKVLQDQLSEAWRLREREFPISPVLTLTDGGLVLGAGTVVLPAEGSRQLKSVDGDELRVLALLSAAYGRPTAPAVLGNIERAAKAWREGDDCLAYIHLAHARFPALDDSREAAQRLFLADAFMKAGAHPGAILEALALDPAFIDAIEKLYNPAQPRVAAGSGPTSGQWTRVGSFLGALATGARAALGRFGAALILRAGGAPAAAFGLLFIPSPNKIRVEGEVPGLPGLHYGWNRDERSLQFTYDNGGGKQRTFSAQLEDDVFRDEHGHAVGRVLPDGTIAIDTAAISSDLVDEDEPKLCPAPGKDKDGSERGRDYEDFIKKEVNPDNPTPRGIGYQLPNPDEGKLVFYDDCQHSTGMMVEMKGPGYAGLLSFDQGKQSLTKEWLAQSGRQIAAAAGRPIRWYFAEPEAAAYAREIFKAAKGGRENIEIEVRPWPGSKQ